MKSPARRPAVRTVNVSRWLAQGKFDLDRCALLLRLSAYGLTRAEWRAVVKHCRKVQRVAGLVAWQAEANAMRTAKGGRNL